MDEGEEIMSSMMGPVVCEQAGKIAAEENTAAKQHKILLALSGVKSDISSFKYAINVCGRLGAGLEILYPPDKAAMSLSGFQTELKKRNVSYRLIASEGRLIEEIQARTDTKRDILFAVIGVPGNMVKSSPDIAVLMKKLKCPLVTVSEPAQT